MIALSIYSLIFLAFFVNSLVGLASTVILMTVKRGACVALFLSIISYFFTHIKLCRLKRSALNERFIIGVVLFFVLVIIVGVVFWERILERNEDLGDIDKIGSGRGTLYRLVLFHWLNADLVNQVFGFGFDSVSSYSGQYLPGGSFAHSDWLEMLHDYGILGVSLLVWLHVELICIVRKAYRRRLSITPSLVMAYVIFSLSNIYSGMLMFPTTIFFALFMGYACAVVNTNQNSNTSRM